VAGAAKHFPDRDTDAVAGKRAQPRAKHRLFKAEVSRFGDRLLTSKATTKTELIS
jgi:hypothetical protein